MNHIARMAFVAISLMLAGQANGQFNGHNTLGDFGLTFRVS